MTSSTRSPLPAREAYRLWAATYDAETPVTALDQLAVQTLGPHLRGCALLDAGCGTGRRLPPVGRSGPRSVVGLDLVPEMLRAGVAAAGDHHLVVGDVRAIPLADDSFDVVWCRLTVGHVRELDLAYRELARVTRTAGQIIVTDFHPSSAQLGHVRGFHDRVGTSHIVEHFVHEPEQHNEAAAGAGLRSNARLDLKVGPAVRRFYEEAGQVDVYERQVGLPIVLALRLTH